MQHILRYYINPEASDERIKELITVCRRAGYGELLLFTSSYDRQPSFLPLDVYRDYADRLRGWMDRFRSEGIKCSINVLQTLGHVYYPVELSQQFHFQRLVDIDGNPSDAGACPIDSALREYTAQVYEILAGVRPRMVFVDDDFRYWMKRQYCFCPLHMQRLSTLLGRGIDRDELKSILLNATHPEHHALRHAFQRVMAESLTELAHIIRGSVDQVAPECPIGLMTAGVPSGWWGIDFAAVTAALAGPRHAPIIRPQIGSYSEQMLSRLLVVARQPAIVRQTLPENTVINPEIENYPYTTWTKSAAYTRLQMAIVHLDGMHQLAVNFYDTLDTTLSENQEITDMCAESAGFYTALEQAIPEGCRSLGITIPLSPKGITCHIPQGGVHSLADLVPDYAAYDRIGRLGLPVGFNWADSDFVLLSGDEIGGFTDAEINQLLSRGALIDLSALEVLLQRGFSDMIPVRLGQHISRNDSGVEIYVDEELCAPFANRANPVRWSASHDGWCRELVATDAAVNVRILSKLDNYRRETIAPLVLGLENKQGKRFGLLAFALSEVTSFMMTNSHRQQEISCLMAWIAGKQLPMTIANAPYVMPMYSAVSETERIAAVINGATDRYDQLMLSFNEGIPTALSQLNLQGVWENITIQTITNSTAILLDQPLDPCDLHVYRIRF